MQKSIDRRDVACNALTADSVFSVIQRLDAAGRHWMGEVEASQIQIFLQTPAITKPPNASNLPSGRPSFKWRRHKTPWSQSDWKYCRYAIDRRFPLHSTIPANPSASSVTGFSLPAIRSLISASFCAVSLVSASQPRASPFTDIRIIHCSFLNCSNRSSSLRHDSADFARVPTFFCKSCFDRSCFDTSGSGGSGSGIGVDQTIQLFAVAGQTPTRCYSDRSGAKRAQWRNLLSPPTSRNLLSRLLYLRCRRGQR